MKPMHLKMMVFAGLLMLPLVESVQAQKFPIPDYQTREQPDGCQAGPSDYGPPPYSVFRDTEDYTYLRDPKKHDDPFDPLKYIPLNSDGSDYLSFGGEIRERWEYYSQPPFGQGPKDTDGYYLQRYMLHADLHLGDILAGGTDLVNPNFADLAKSVGLHGIRVEDPGDLKSAVADAFAHNGPALLDIVVNRTELSMPPTIKLDQAVGFNLWALKAVLNGRGDEVLDLAVTNLLR